MDFLSGYGSESDDDSQVQKEHTSKNAAYSFFDSLPPLKSDAKRLREEATDGTEKRKRVQIFVDLPKARPKVEELPEPLKKESLKKGLFAILPPPKAPSKPVPDPNTLGVSSIKSFIPLSVSKNRISTETGSASESRKGTMAAENLVEDSSDSFFSLDFSEATAGESTGGYSRPKLAMLDDVDVPLPMNMPAGSSYNSCEYNDTEHDHTASGSQAPTDEIIQSRDVGLMRRSKRGQKEAPIQFLEVSQTEQLGDTWRMESQRNLTRDRPNMGSLGSFEAAKPTYMGKKRHNIMALAYDAKMREAEIADAFALRRAQKSASRAKYGF